MLHNTLHQGWTYMQGPGADLGSGYVWHVPHMIQADEMHFFFRNCWLFDSVTCNLEKCKENEQE